MLRTVGRVLARTRTASFRQYARGNSSSTVQKSIGDKTQYREKPGFARRRFLLGTAVAASALAAYSNFVPQTEQSFAYAAVARSLRTVVTGMSIVMDYKLSLYNKQHLSVDEYRKLRSEVHLRSARRMLDTIQRNGGVYVKLGQHVSALAYLLPAEYCETMRVLQDQCTPSSLEEIKRLFIEDLGQAFDEIFSTFDPTPLGVASLAQVHRATLKCGREVAIKIQHPNIRRFSHLDIELTSAFVKFVKHVFPEFTFEWLAHEIRLNLPLELDFRREAQNTERVRRNFSNIGRFTRVLGHRNLKIPEVYWSHDRLLCMEFIHGAKIDNLNYYHTHGINPVQVSAELTRIFSEMIFVNGWLHADPHPGNLLIQHKPVPKSFRNLLSAVISPPKNFEIVLLDHGLYRELNPHFQQGYARLWRSLLRGNEREIRHWSKEVAKVDMYHIFACMLTGRDWSTITSDIRVDRSSNELDSIVGQASQLFLEITQILAQVPPELLLIFKTNDLLRSIEKSLGASEWLSASVMSSYVMWVCNQSAINGEHENSWRNWWDYIVTSVMVRSFETAMVWRERLARLYVRVGLSRAT